MLPGMSGIDVCRQIRVRSRVPIIMVTAKSSEIDTVVGLEVGADDYITKPYRIRELVARMRAVLRRAPREASEEEPGEALVVGDVSLDPDRHEVTLRGEPLPLPLKEFELLEALMEHAGRVLTRDQLMDPRSGATTTSATARPSTSTSSASAAASRTTPATPSASPRSAAWGTATSAERRRVCPGRRGAHR